MRFRAVSACLGVAVLLFAASGPHRLRAQETQPIPGAPSPGQSGNSIQQTVNEVPVLFTVFDKHDKTVNTLNKEDFYVLDDGVRQEILSFSKQTNLPLRVGLLMDTSNSIRERLKFEQDAATDFLFNVLKHNNDQAFLMTVDDDPEVIQGFTSDTQRLRDVIMKQRAGGGTALYDAIYTACQQLLQAPPPAPGSGTDVRRVMVVISDGEDNLSRHSRSDALQMAQRAGVVVYAISTSIDWVLTDQETSSSNSANRKVFHGEGDDVLQQFSDDSGGRAFFPYHADDLAQSFADIGDELRSEYSLTYRPAGRVYDGKWHTVHVAVNPPTQLQVHARKGYFATSSDAAPLGPAEAAPRNRQP